MRWTASTRRDDDGASRWALPPPAAATQDVTVRKCEAFYLPPVELLDYDSCDTYNRHMSGRSLYGADAVASLEDDALQELGMQVRLERLRRTESWRRCENCKAPFPARADARYCSGRCRTAVYRQRLQQEGA